MNHFDLEQEDWLKCGANHEFKERNLKVQDFDFLKRFQKLISSSCFTLKGICFNWRGNNALFLLRIISLLSLTITVKYFETLALLNIKRNISYFKKSYILRKNYPQTQWVSDFWLEIVFVLTLNLEVYSKLQPSFNITSQ